MIASWKIVDSGKKDLHWNIYWCKLNADINAAEVGQEISTDQAWYLRENSFRLNQGDYPMIDFTNLPVRNKTYAGANGSKTK